MENSPFPDWLTADFLKSCLESDEKLNNIKIIDYSPEPGVGAGNNYGSQILKLKIKYRNLIENSKDDTISLVIKTPVIGEVLKNFNEIYTDVYEKEPKYYNEFIKATYKLCKHDVVAKSFIPKNLKYTVLEDLKESGYKMVNRVDLLDFDHCKLYVEASSKLHALSVAIHKKNPHLIESLGSHSPKSTENWNKMNRALLTKGLRCMSAYLQDKPKYEMQLDIIEQLKERQTMWKFFKDVENSKRPLMALTQGDPWCTNMMFKYNEQGNVVSTKLLDFQYLKYTSPVAELAMFLAIGPNQDVRETKICELTTLYCDCLNRNLSELHCPERLSYEDMKKDLLFYSPIAVLGLFTFLPVSITTLSVDMNSFMSEEDSNQPIEQSALYPMYKGDLFDKYFPQIIDRMTDEGVFDYLKSRLQNTDS